MIDVIKEINTVLLNDAALMGLLNNDPNAVCRIKATSEKTKPRIEATITDDYDGDFYDNKPSTYSADISFSVYSDSGNMFPIVNRLDEILTEYGFTRTKHTEGYFGELTVYFTDLHYRCKIQYVNNAENVERADDSDNAEDNESVRDTEQGNTDKNKESEGYVWLKLQPTAQEE